MNFTLTSDCVTIASAIVSVSDSAARSITLLGEDLATAAVRLLAVAALAMAKADNTIIAIFFML